MVFCLFSAQFAILSSGFRAFVALTEVSQGGLLNKVFSPTGGNWTTDGRATGFGKQAISENYLVLTRAIVE